MIETSSVEEIFQKYGEMMYKLCIVMLKKTYDAEDTVQDALIKYMLKKPLFETYEHEKAWLIRVLGKIEVWTCQIRMMWK